MIEAAEKSETGVSKGATTSAAFRVGKKSIIISPQREPAVGKA
jgi:hypothetical protein